MKLNQFTWRTSSLWFLQKLFILQFIYVFFFLSINFPISHWFSSGLSWSHSWKGNRSSNIRNLSRGDAHRWKENQDFSLQNKSRLVWQAETLLKSPFSHSFSNLIIIIRIGIMYKISYFLLALNRAYGVLLNESRRPRPCAFPFFILEIWLFSVVSWSKAILPDITKFWVASLVIEKSWLLGGYSESSRMKFSFF